LKKERIERERERERERDIYLDIFVKLLKGLHPSSGSFVLFVFHFFSKQKQKMKDPAAIGSRGNRHVSYVHNRHSWRATSHYGCR